MNNKFINLICFFVIIVATVRVYIELPSLNDQFKYFLMIVFPLLVWGASAIEISIKPGLLAEKPKRKIFFDLFLFWLIPLIMGLLIGYSIRSGWI